MCCSPCCWPRTCASSQVHGAAVHRDRFYSKSVSTVAVVCLLTASLTYIIGQMTGVGVVLALPERVVDTGIYIGQAIVFLYAVFGGMKGITTPRLPKDIVLICAYIVPAVFISLNLTGNPLPQLGLGSTMSGSDVALLTRLDQVVTDLGFGKARRRLREAR